MTEKPYFPPLYGEVDCCACDISEDCWCVGKYQRNRRDFTHTSGRCPRLPDRRGFVEPDERGLYAATFPLIHAERGEGDSLDLTLTVPGDKRSHKVYRSKSGFWYFKAKNTDGETIKHALSVEGNEDKDGILQRMEAANADYCIFRCELLENIYL